MNAGWFLYRRSGAFFIGGIAVGLFDWLKGKFSRDKPPVENSYRYSAFPFFFGATTAGKTVNEMTAMQTTAVYACVRILAESIASLPLHVYQYKDRGKERAPNHPLFYLLHDAPNVDMTSFVFRETLMTHLLLWGNAYAQIVWDGAGRVSALYPLQPNKMTIERTDSKELIYSYTAGDDSNPNLPAQTVKLRRIDVLHIAGLGFDGVQGYSPIAMARNAIGLTLACEEFGAAFFKNGARPSGILEHPGLIKNPERLRESWQAAYGGSGNAGKVAILEEGMKYQQISIPPEDAQFLETRKFQTAEVARIFRVPPHLIADLDRATFSNIENQSLEFVRYTLNPWVVRWEQALNKALLLQSEKSRYFVRFNVDGLMRGDYASRMQGYATARQNGWMSSNDIRELEDMNPLSDEDGGNLYLVNGNMIRLNDSKNFAEAGGKNA